MQNFNTKSYIFNIKCKKTHTKTPVTSTDCSSRMCSHWGGDKILFPMATGREVEQQTLIYRGKENFKAENGVKYRCLVFSLVEYDKNKKEKEVITFYVTDDKNHLPVRLDLYLNFGSAKAFLQTIEGNRHPLTSIVN